MPSDVELPPLRYPPTDHHAEPHGGHVVTRIGSPHGSTYHVPSHVRAKPSRGCLHSLSNIIKYTFPTLAVYLADRSKIKTSTVQAAEPDVEHGSAMGQDSDGLNIHVRERQHSYGNLRLVGTLGMGRLIGQAY